MRALFKNVHFVLLLGCFMGLLGASVYNFFYDGSSIHKKIVNDDVIERVSENDIEEISTDYLFGGKPLDEERLSNIDQDAEKHEVENLAFANSLEKWETTLLLILLAGLLVQIVTFKRSENWFIFSVFYLGAGFYIFYAAYCTMRLDGSAYAYLAPLAHATRYGLPLLLILWICRRFLPEQHLAVHRLIFINVASLLCAVTFAIHGLEAYEQNPGFIDLVIGSANTIGIEMFTEPGVRKLLVIIGVMDVTLAILVMLKRTRCLLVWMAFWGVITALSRPLSMGIDSWYEVAARTGNFLIPMILLLFLTSIRGVQEKGVQNTTNDI